MSTYTVDGSGLLKNAIYDLIMLSAAIQYEDAALVDRLSVRTLDTTSQWADRNNISVLRYALRSGDLEVLHGVVLDAIDDLVGLAFESERSE